MATEESHLKVIKIVMIITGLWTLEKSHRLYMIYQCYSKTYRYIYYLNLASILMKIPISWGNREDLIENLSFSITYTLILVALRYTSNDTIKDLLRQILEKEKIILNHSNKEVRDVYFHYTRYNNKTNAYIFGSVFILMIGLYVVWIHLAFKGIEDNLLFPVYMPFNLLTPFWVGFSYSSVQLFIAGFFYIYTKMLFISLMIYAVALLKLLQHFLQKLISYSIGYSKSNEVSMEEAKHTIIRSCIFEHKAIIKYI